MTRDGVVVRKPNFCIWVSFWSLFSMILTCFQHFVSPTQQSRTKEIRGFDFDLLVHYFTHNDNCSSWTFDCIDLLIDTAAEVKDLFAKNTYIVSFIPIVSSS